MSDLPDAIARINALTTNARNTWFALLGVLVFVGITLMGVEHIDFYGVDRATQLPLVNVEVPTRFFFYAAPILTAAIYGYFHLYLIRLWDTLSVAEPRTTDDRPLGDVISPWLVTDAALHMRRCLRKGEKPCTTPRTMEGPAMMLNVLLAWGFGLVVMFFLWWQSMPARDVVMTAVAGAALLASVFTGAASLAMLVHRMRAAPNCTKSNIFSTVPSMTALLVLVPAVALIGYHRTNGSPRFLAPINLQNQSIVERPSNWLRRDYAEREFRAAWCRRENIVNCYIGNREAEYGKEWITRRADNITALKKPRLNKVTRIEAETEVKTSTLSETEVYALLSQKAVNLHGADLRNAFLSGADLSTARLGNANLSGAQMEGTILRGAQLQQADLVWTVLQKADLSGAQLQGADLREAELQAANLFRAHLQNANLRAAQLQEALLIGSQLQEAILIKAELEAADLRGAHLQNVKLFGASLRQADLRRARLQEADLGEAQLQEADLRGAQLQATDLGEAQLQKADLRRAYLQEAVLLKAQLQYADLGGAQLDGTNLFQTQLQEANLSFSFLTGSSERLNSLQFTNVSASLNNGGALRFLDLTGLRFNGATDFRNVFLDGSVRYTGAFARQMGGDLNKPCQWWPDQLPDVEFFGRWRGWIVQESSPMAFWGQVAPVK